jgi:hypothetical protein
LVDLRGDRRPGEQKTNLVTFSCCRARTCSVSFVDVRGIHHAAEVEAESLYEAIVLGVRRLNGDSWIERIGPATVLDVEVREPSTKHAISLQQIERWLAGATTNPDEASKKAQLKMMLLTK